MGLDDPDDNAAERTANFISATALDVDLSDDAKRRAGEAVHHISVR
jgi:hypothetical protein